MKLLKTLLTRAAVWFTVVSLITLIFGLLFLPEEDHVTAFSFLMFFPLSVCAAAAGMIFGDGRIPAVWRYLSHYVIFLVSLVLFVILPANVSLTAPFWIVTALLFTVLWWLSRGLVHILKARLSGEK